jgi:TrpR-related protein YerC/YecD
MPDFSSKRLTTLLRAIRLLENELEGQDFFSDLCSPVELEAMAARWEVVLMLKQGFSYRVIQDKTGVSLTTITRVSRFLHRGASGYALVYKRFKDRYLAGN